jgi:hypothetical protein
MLDTRETDESEPQDGTIVIYEDAFDAPTTKRMLDFLNHGEYDIGTAQEGAFGDDDDKITKLYVLSHLFCFAIAEDYQVKQLSIQALSEFSKCLSIVSPADFAELMGVIAAHTDATPVHKALRNAASTRQDELAACKEFVKILSCRHIAEPATQDQSTVSDLKTAKQLAAHGAKLFRIANHTATVRTVERSKVVKSYQEALKDIEKLRLQVDEYSSTPVKDEQVHVDAIHALQASDAVAKQAKDDLLVSEERASRLTQAMQKMKLELEVFRNAEHNNKLALEKANKEASDPRLALEEDLENSKAELAILRAALEASQEANCAHVNNEQRLTAEIQRASKDLRTNAVELTKVKAQRDRAEIDQRGAARGTTRVKNEFFVSQKNLARATLERDASRASLEKVKQDRDDNAESLNQVARQYTRTLEQRDRAKAERDQASMEQATTAQMLEKVNQEFASQFNQVVAENTALGKFKLECDQAKEEQKRTASELKKSTQESVRSRSQRDEVRAENATLRTQARNTHNAMSEGARMLMMSTQQNEAMVQQAAETAGLRAEVNQLRLHNFTLQRSIYDLQFVILSNAENKQQLLEYGGMNNFAPQ